MLELGPGSSVWGMSLICDAHQGEERPNATKSSIRVSITWQVFIKKIQQNTSFCPLRPFFACPSPLNSSLTASKASFVLDPARPFPASFSDTRASGEMSIALRNGIGTVLPAAYIDQSYKWKGKFIGHWKIRHGAQRGRRAIIKSEILYPGSVIKKVVRAYVWAQSIYLILNRKCFTAWAATQLSRCVGKTWWWANLTIMASHSPLCTHMLLHSSSWSCDCFWFLYVKMII